MQGRNTSYNVITRVIRDRSTRTVYGARTGNGAPVEFERTTTLWLPVEWDKPLPVRIRFYEWDQVYPLHLWVMFETKRRRDGVLYPVLRVKHELELNELAVRVVAVRPSTHPDYPEIHDTRVISCEVIGKDYKSEQQFMRDEALREPFDPNRWRYFVTGVYCFPSLEVLEKLKKYSTYPDAIMPGAGIRDFADEFSKVLAEFKKTRCWIFKDAKGQEYGVRPPKGFYGVLGVVAMPWNLMRIDYDAQRWTDIPHIAKILMKFDPQMAQGITARITLDGKKIDVNEGRHGAMLIALTGAPYCWGRAIVSDNRGRNFDIFELLNIIPKPTELYDEFRIKAGRAKMYKEAGDEIKQEVGGRIEDQHAYDLSELNHNHDVRFVPSAKKKGGKKTLLKRGDAFRIDKLYSFFEDGQIGRAHV